MKICGLIVEYNPFHKGHIYHIEQSKKITDCDLLIAVMSGNFSQRGEPMVCDKWTRANIAIEYGVDLVIELPYYFATQNADRFAYGAIESLKNCDIDSLVFGSECGNIESLQEIAKMPFDVNRFKENMDAGYSYPKAYGLFDTYMGPNDILATAYLKQIENSQIKAYAIKRTNAYFSDELENISSGYAIRNAKLKGLDISNHTPLANQLDHIYTWNDYYPYLRTLLLTQDANEIAKRLLVNEGIENLLIKNAKKYSTYDDFINACITRRYTKARIQRTLLHILSQTNKDEINDNDIKNYIRVLAYNDKGRNYLKILRKKENLIIANKFSQIPENIRNVEYKATVVYSLANPSKQKEIIEKEIYGNYP